MWLEKLKLPNAADALPGRRERVAVSALHEVFGAPLDGVFEGMSRAMFALGPFWDAERRYWELAGVLSTQVGYAGGFTPNPTYEEVGSGRTGHAQVVRVVFDPRICDYEALLRAFWESHDPTQGMRQGSAIGTQYRSLIFCFDLGQHAAAADSRNRYQAALSEQGFGAITTEIREASEFYFAEPEHQQYLIKRAGGDRGVGGTGVSYPPMHAG